MSLKPLKHRNVLANISPWMLLGAVIILALVVVVFAVRNLDREKKYMASILSEKGAALISAIESGARTGMMRENVQLQALLEETARQAGILYLVVTDPKGLILVDNEKSRIGQSFRSEASMQALEIDATERWRQNDQDDSQRAFEVYRYFRPFTGSDGTNIAGSDQIIFVGLDVDPFESAIEEDVRNTIVTSTVLLLVGFGGFLTLFWVHNYRAARRLLQDTRAFASEVVANLPVGLIATGPNGRVAFLNEAAEGITGHSFEEAKGKHPDTILPSEWCGLKALLDEGQPVIEREMECSFCGDKSIPLSVSAAKILNEEGYFVGHMLILRDLREVRSLQEEIRQREKLAALGGMAAGIAHEIRNPLSSIKGLATYFRGKFDEGSEGKEASEVMLREVDRLNRVITELLEFARPSDLKLKSVDINEILDHSVRFIEQDSKIKDVEIKLSTNTDLPLVPIDADRFFQALLNLYLNAIDAMERGGVLSIMSTYGGNEHIKVEISDTGSGISPRDLKRVFDPYFTTKPGGTGLGLAIVHKIVEAHKGKVKVESLSGRGTVFSILLPVR